MQYAWYDSAIIAVGTEGIMYYWKQIDEPPRQKYFCLDRSSDGLTISVAPAARSIMDNGEKWYEKVVDLTGGAEDPFPSLGGGKVKTYRLQPQESIEPSTNAESAEDKAAAKDFEDADVDGDGALSTE